MGVKVCFIGGASAAGKSSIAAEIADAHGRQAFKLDRFFLMAKKTGLSGEALNDAARAMSLEYVSELIGAGNPCVVEGTWIRPAQAAGLIAGEAFHPVFCGFPNADPKAHLKRIWTHYAETGHLHWLMGKDTEEALAFLQAQVEDSRQLRDECGALGIAYFDFSVFEDGAAALTAHFQSQLADGAGTKST